MLTILDATTQSACAAAATQQAWCEALIAAWSGGNVTARLFAPDGTTLRRTLTLGPFTISNTAPRQVLCAAHLADTPVSTGAPGLWVFRSGSTDIFSIDAGTGAASVNHTGSIKALCTPTLDAVTFTAPSNLPASAIPAYRAAMTVANRFYSVTPSPTLEQVDPEDDAAINPNHPGQAPWYPSGSSLAEIWNAWGGGDFNVVTMWWIGDGGGHAGYMGNEPYRVNVAADSLGFSRLCPPSGSIPRPATFVGGNPASLSPSTNQDLCTDGRPKAVHVYGVAAQDDDGIYYHGPGGAKNNIGGEPSAGGGPTTRCTAFDPVAGDWDWVGPQVPNVSAAGATCCYDSLRDLLWVTAGQRCHKISKTDGAVIQTYGASPIPGFSNGTPQYGLARYIPGDDYVVVLDCETRKLLVWPASDPTQAVYLEAADIPGTVPPLTGAKYHGFAWDEAGRQFILYAGGTDVRTATPPSSGSWLVAANWSWGQITTDTTVYTPPADTGNGMFGRVFVAYNALYAIPSNVASPIVVMPLR